MSQTQNERRPLNTCLTLYDEAQAELYDVTQI